ncbi:GNAT family N-acetyltransferase [Aquimarina algiphila]|uniref:GNAT family N-acetyltransferase n=1 Tax=Aquimarina algiphila TaxID=2047982 RepID=A0A554VE60_9FLAO|nr:GNAT family N-acetyltransferase [Aquimarina algiphila]TSE05313.1 GNAT family N-acetyltransferase [Aquimarina algiphila]
MGQPNNITVRKAIHSEMDWINMKYKEVDFTSSNFDTEDIVIAEIENQKCGLGRLTKIDADHLELGGIYVFSKYRGLGIADAIVKKLLELTTPEKRVWCLPFKNLKSFYSKFDFVDYQKYNYQIPDKVFSKYQWCNSTYDKEVLLLVK